MNIGQKYCKLFKNVVFIRKYRKMVKNVVNCPSNEKFMTNYKKHTKANIYAILLIFNNRISKKISVNDDTLIFILKYFFIFIHIDGLF